MKWILLISLLSFSNAQAASDGNSVNNGGGVICIAGKCKTLIEAGIEIKPDFQGVWIPESENIRDVRKLIDNAPLVDDLKQPLEMQVLGRVDHFRRATVIDPVKLDEIKRQYIDVVNQSGFALDPKTFELVAFSSDNTVKPALTYLLPKFFELSRTQQASILLHEGLYRGRPTTDLKYVLQFEYAISNERCKNRQGKTDGQLAAYHLGYLTKGQLISHMLSALGSRKEDGCYLYGTISFDTGHFGRADFLEEKDKMTLNLDPLKLLNIGEIDPKFPYIFSRVKKIKFKLVREGNGVLNGSRFYMSDGSYALSYETKQGAPPNTYYTYEIEDPNSLDLVLPK